MLLWPSQNFRTERNLSSKPISLFCRWDNLGPEQMGNSPLDAQLAHGREEIRFQILVPGSVLSPRCQLGPTPKPLQQLSSLPSWYHPLRHSGVFCEAWKESIVLLVKNSFKKLSLNTTKDYHTCPLILPSALLPKKQPYSSHSRGLQQPASCSRVLQNGSSSWRGLPKRYLGSDEEPVSKEYLESASAKGFTQRIYEAEVMSRLWQGLRQLSLE